MSRMGSQELVEWMAFYELQQEDEQAAIEAARAGK
jgi:hypothetical protein